MDASKITKTVIADARLLTGEDVTLESRLVADLGFDDLDYVELAMDMEDEFDIHISEERRDSWKTIGDVVKLVTELVG